MILLEFAPITDSDGAAVPRMSKEKRGWIKGESKHVRGRTRRERNIIRTKEMNE